MWWYCSVRWLRSAARLRTTYSVEAELALVALVLLAWHAVRIPLEGSVARLARPCGERPAARGRAVARHRGVVHPTRLGDGRRTGSRVALQQHPPPRPLRFRRGDPPASARPVPEGPHDLRPVVRARRDRRSPRIHSPRLAGFRSSGLGPAPREAELGASGALFHNETAASGKPALRLRRVRGRGDASGSSHARGSLSIALAYPVLVFVVIVGNGKPLRRRLRRGLADVRARGARSLGSFTGAPPLSRRPAQPGAAALAAAGYGLVAWGLVSLDFTTPATWNNVGDALILAVARRRWSSRRASESRKPSRRVAERARLPTSARSRRRPRARKCDRSRRRVAPRATSPQGRLEPRARDGRTGTGRSGGDPTPSRQQHRGADRRRRVPSARRRGARRTPARTCTSPAGTSRPSSPSRAATSR